jgi:hypothetical protein
MSRSLALLLMTLSLVGLCVEHGVARQPKRALVAIDEKGDGQTSSPTSAIAIGAHRLGRALASQWVNVIVTDQSRVHTYAERAAADIAAALAQ